MHKCLRNKDTRLLSLVVETISVSKATQDWLSQHEVPYDLLVLRPDKFKDESWPVAEGNPATYKMRFIARPNLKERNVR